MNRLIFTAIFFISFFSLIGQEMTIHFTGRVYNDKNAIISGANIKILQDEFLSSSTQSGIDGSYNIYLPLEHDYDITVTKPGYEQKKYFVSTKSVPQGKEFPEFPNYVADVILFSHIDGVDYSLFEKPINKYKYNPFNKNMDYDEPYLKEMKLAMKELRKAEKEAMAKEKVLYDKKLSDKPKYVSSPLKIKSNQNPIKGNSQEKVSSVQTIYSTVKKEVTDPKVLSLLAKYKPGITEEIIEGNGVRIIQRVVVKENEVWIYQKKVFSWGGVACFRDAVSITETIFEQETRI